MNTIKEQFECPMLEIINLSCNDVIATSGEDFGVSGNQGSAYAE